MRRIAALIAALALVGGCGTTESSLSDSMVGHWVTDLHGIHIVFLDDGSYGKGHSPAQASPKDVSFAELEWGTWSTDGNILTITPDTTSAYCGKIVATYEIEVLDDGNRLEVTVLDDDCTKRPEDFGSGLTRYTDNGQ